jgi:nicotinate-nucleotide adenylyltransferase
MSAAASPGGGASTRTLAIYGGSFDPPHVAHTLVCAYVLAAYPIDRVIVVPTAQHAFAKPLAPFEHRLRMCELATRDLQRVEVSAIERDLPAPSLTLRTLEHLQRAEPDARLRLVIGSDLIAETASWYEFDRVRALAPELVVQRAGAVTDATQPALPEISSTEIRSRLRAGLSTDGLLSPEVAAYAREHALYR